MADLCQKVWYSVSFIKMLLQRTKKEGWYWCGRPPRAHFNYINKAPTFITFHLNYSYFCRLNTKTPIIIFVLYNLVMRHIFSGAELIILMTLLMINCLWKEDNFGTVREFHFMIDKVWQHLAGALKWAQCYCSERSCNQI
jgi:hypothetical protein